MSAHPWSEAGYAAMVRADSIAFRPLPGSMTESKPTAPARIAPAGLMFLAITSVGWGSTGRSQNTC
jgi:hypothetical protein